MTRRIIGGAFLSLDGVMQAPGGPSEDPTGEFPWGGWLTGVFDEGLGDQVDRLFSGDFDLLLGRRTYDIFAAHWPFIPDDEPIAAAFRRVRKYVMSWSDGPLDWEGSHRIGSMEELAALKAGDGPDLVIQGSSTLYPQLLRHGLLDRLVTMTAPIVLGQGKRLFGDDTPAGAFTLIEQRTTASGVVMATYEPAGEIVIGSFAMPEPSRVEVERQKMVASGSW